MSESKKSVTKKKKGKKFEEIDDPKLLIPQLIKLFNDVKSLRVDGRSPGNNCEIPFNIEASSFLQFAEVDLNINIEHRYINCLSNLKRAMDCQCDSLLLIFGLFDKSKKENWNFPKKMKILDQLGILTPRVLHKINSKRNLLEHEYTIPKLEDVEDALDIAGLFISMTNFYLKGFPNNIDFLFEHQKKPAYVSFYFNYKSKKLGVELVRHEKDKVTTYKSQFGFNSDDYYIILKDIGQRKGFEKFVLGW